MFYLILYGAAAIAAWAIANVVIGVRGKTEKDYPVPLVVIGAIIWPLLLFLGLVHLFAISVDMMGKGIVLAAQELQKFGKSFRKDDIA